MPRLTAKTPPPQPEGWKWCPRHKDGEGAWLRIGEFPRDYGYCFACKAEYQRQWNQSKRAELRASRRQRVFDTYGGQCQSCGESDRRVLDIYPKDRYYTIIKENFPPRYRLLCKNCRYLEVQQ